MTNCIASAVRDSGLSVAEVSRRSNVKYVTVYDAVNGKTNIDRMGIDTFRKIAHALGMTVDDLYNYGNDAKNDGGKYADPRQAEINEIYQSVTEEGKHIMWTNAIMARNTFLAGDRGDSVQEAK